ncbi:MAG: histone deacetylase [Proteobacteria bacterium]|nr:histone deacetylase [Pseudomonadota bacterium]
MATRTGLDPRRADLARLALLQLGALRSFDVHTPRRIALPDLARVHTDSWLAETTDREVLADVIGAPIEDVNVAHVLRTFRLGCGGTLEATEWALEHQQPALNLLGGFHHASPERGSGLCVYNDVAASIATVRAQGFTKPIGVLDLDAHPPDGIAACLADVPDVFIGSISGSDWGELEGVDETCIPGADDETYLEALRALLERMPRCDLVYVLAGGDVLKDDHFGLLELTVHGARRRDQAVRGAIAGAASVWMPAGGYSNQAWRVLTHTGLTLAGLDRVSIPGGAITTLTREFERIANTLTDEELSGPLFSESEIIAMLGGPGGEPRLLGTYTVDGVEAALQAYGFLEPIRRLGYRDLDVKLEVGGAFDRLTLTGEAKGLRHVLVEASVAREHLNGHVFLLVNWFTLRHPIGQFSERRPRLPGQEVPGLGLSKEAVLLFERVAKRLALDGVLIRPAGFHIAWSARRAFVFLDAHRDGRFVAMCRDLVEAQGHSVLQASKATAEGRVRLNGEAYAWEPTAMVYWLEPHERDDNAVLLEAEASSFTIV